MFENMVAMNGAEGVVAKRQAAFDVSYDINSWKLKSVNADGLLHLVCAAPNIECANGVLCHINALPLARRCSRHPPGVCGHTA